jgi:hypothetical protein
MLIRETGGESNGITATVKRISESIFSNAGAKRKTGKSARKANEFTSCFQANRPLREIFTHWA